MESIREDLVMRKETREGTLYLTEDGGVKMYFKKNLIW